jgi:hypothetical protein
MASVSLACFRALFQQAVLYVNKLMFNQKYALEKVISLKYFTRKYETN